MHKYIRKKGGKQRSLFFLAKPRIIDLISLVAAAFRHPFQQAALFCLAVDASQISSLVKQAFVQVPHKNDWFGFYQELWLFSTTRKTCIYREVYQDGNSETNILHVQQNPLSPLKQASLGRNFSHSGMKTSCKESGAAQLSALLLGEGKRALFSFTIYEMCVPIAKWPQDSVLLRICKWDEAHYSLMWKGLLQWECRDV